MAVTDKGLISLLWSKGKIDTPRIKITKMHTQKMICISLIGNGFEEQYFFHCHISLAGPCCDISTEFKTHHFKQCSIGIVYSLAGEKKI